MLTFAQPMWLLALPIAGLIGWLWARGRRAALRYSDLSLVTGLPRGRASWMPIVSLALRVIVLTSLIVAAAGPRIPDRRTRLPVEGIAIVLAIDTSGSMGEPDFLTPIGNPTTRLAAAKESFRLFVEGGETADGPKFLGRPDDLLGLVAFAAWPESTCPLTINRGVVLDILDTLQPKVGPDAGTNIGDALAESLIRLESTGPRRKVIVLLSDGEHNIAIERADPPLKPRQAAQLAANLDIPIYAIDCGGSTAMDPEAIERRAEGRLTMETIASMTGGKAFAAGDLATLRETLVEIDRLERRPADSFLYRRYHELAVWCGGLAAVSLIVLVLSESVFARVLTDS